MVTTAFDSAVQKVAREKNGDGVTLDLFWDITVALGTDIEAINAQGQERHDETLELLSAHVAEDEEARHAQAEDCARKHEELFGRKPRRSTDSEDVDYGGKSAHHYTQDFVDAGESRRRYSKEQIVTAIIIFIATISANALIVWLIVHSLEEASRH
jgi:hypothetical protein